MTRRFYPHISPGEGQFIALFRRTTSDEREEAPKRKKERLPQKPSKTLNDSLALARKFLEENLDSYPKGELYAVGNLVYLKPDIALPSYGVVAAGVCVGEIVGSRLVPHHHLFSAYGKQFKRRVMLNHRDCRAYDYLVGLEIKTEGCLDYEEEPEGWAAVIIDGCSTGGGKISGGICKNHYPKGLRNKR